MQNFGKKDKEGVTITWNLAQKTLKCCGVTGKENWDNTPFDRVPESCYKGATCEIDFKSCTKGSSNAVYEEGCLTKIEDFVKSNTNLVAGIGIGIAVFQIL